MSRYIIKCKECGEIWSGSDVDVQIPAFEHYNDTNHDRFISTDPISSRELEPIRLENGYTWNIIEEDVGYDIKLVSKEDHPYL